MVLTHRFQPWWGSALALVLVAAGPATAAAVAAAPARLLGRVHELGSPDPVPGATIAVLGTTLRAVSDGRGFYGLSGSAGAWTLRATADGYVPLSRTVRLKPGQALHLDLGLNPQAFQGAEVTVRAHREAAQAIQASVSQREIKALPGSFGDALRAVQALPGVGAPNDFSGQLLVQGAGPNDNLYLIDNLPWPIPFHFGGLVSTVSPDLLDTVDLYEAGYDARWGGSLASVLDAHTRAPDTDRLHVSADLSLLEASAALEGPLGVGGATFTLTGRRSYFELAGRLAKLQAVPSYWDAGASVDFSLGPHDHIHALMLASDDTLNFTASPDSSTANTGRQISGPIHFDQDFQSGGFSWINSALPGLVSTFTPYAYHTDSIQELDILKDNSYRSSLGVKEEAVWKAGRWLGADHNLGAGGDLVSSSYAFEGSFPRVTDTTGVSFGNLTSLPQVASTLQAQGFNGDAYLEDRVGLGSALALTLGLHYDASNLVADGRLGPRASLEWRPDAASKLTAAWGLYDQPPSPLQLNPQFGNPGLQPQDAQHAVLSYQRQISPSLLAKADVYDKTLSGLVVADPSNPNLYANQGLGDVKGLDLYLKEDLGERFFGWISYSLSKSERLPLPTDGWQLYQYDQPNILTLVGSWRVTPAWTLGGKLRYASGNLAIPAGGDSYTQRLDDYLRLDLRLGRAWRFQTWKLSCYGEILNVLDRSNTAMQLYDSSTGETTSVPDFPFFPNLGLQASY